jgi:hypothetical protein
MKRLYSLILALAAVLAISAAASASSLRIYTETGFPADQYFFSNPLPSEWEVTPWAAGLTWEAGRWLIGADYFNRAIDMPLQAINTPLREEDQNVYDEAPSMAINTFDIYGGVKLASGKSFKLYGLAGYADNTLSIKCPFGKAEFAVNGIAFGLGASVNAGPFVIQGKVLTVPTGDAGMTAKWWQDPDYWMGFGAKFDGGSFTLADLRCLWPCNDRFGIYAAYHYAATNIMAGNTTVPIGQATWYAVGASLTF